MKNENGGKGAKLASAALILAAFVVLCAVLGISGFVKSVGSADIISPEAAAELVGNKFPDCVLVLGCRVYDDGTPSAMLYDRVQRSVELYKAGGAAPKLLMSGDRSSDNYDEPGVMKRLAVESGVPSENVFTDRAGFSTYESVYRAKTVYGANNMIIVTQKYHLPRALYIARKLGTRAFGVAADYRSYGKLLSREARETLARDKDFALSAFKFSPERPGDSVPINGNAAN